MLKPIETVLNIAIVTCGHDKEYCHNNCPHLPEGNIIGKRCGLFKEELVPVRSSGSGGLDDLGFMYLRADVCRFFSRKEAGTKGTVGTVGTVSTVSTVSPTLARAQQVLCGMTSTVETVPKSTARDDGADGSKVPVDTDTKCRTDRFLQDPLVCPYCRKKFEDRMTAVLHRARCASSG